jgi:signal transduction histidine kinase
MKTKSERASRSDAPAFPIPPAWAWWLTTSAFAVLTVLSGFFIANGRDTPPEIAPPSTFALVLLVVVAASLFARRFRPLAALAITVLCTATAYAFNPDHAGFQFALLMTVFAVTRVSNRRRALIIGAVTAVFLAVALLVGDTSIWSSGQLWIMLLTTALATAAGDATRTRRVYIDAIMERAVRAEESRESEARRRVAEDRLRIARDLHDAVAHQIAVVNLHASVASQALAERPDDAERSLATIREAARNVLAEISALLKTLRSSEGSTPDAGPGITALPSLISEIQSIGMQVNYALIGTAQLLPREIDVVAYRAIQEALTNAHKHGVDGSVDLELVYQESAFTIVARNAFLSNRDGGSTPGHGLTGMKERVHEMSGHINVVAKDGVFSLTVKFPLLMGTAS